VSPFDGGDDGEDGAVVGEDALPSDDAGVLLVAGVDDVSAAVVAVGFSSSSPPQAASNEAITGAAKPTAAARFSIARRFIRMSNLNGGVQSVFRSPLSDIQPPLVLPATDITFQQYAA
jgi:hypothetical protein